MPDNQFIERMQSLLYDLLNNDLDFDIVTDVDSFHEAIRLVDEKED